jgi:hypothetical protein
LKHDLVLFFVAREDVIFFVQAALNHLRLVAVVLLKIAGEIAWTVLIKVKLRRLSSYGEISLEVHRETLSTDLGNTCSRHRTLLLE